MKWLGKEGNEWHVLSFLYRVCADHGKCRESWNLRISFSMPGRSWNLIIGARKSWKIKVLFGRLY